MRHNCRVVSVQSLSHVWFFVTPWTAARQASLSITSSRSLLTLMFIESIMLSNQLFLCHLLLLLPSVFPSIRVFSSESVLRIRWPKYRSFSFSISPSMNTQDWFPLLWTGCISLQSKWFSRVFSNTTVKKHQFFSAQLSLIQLLTPYMTTGKIIVLTRWTFVGKVTNVFTFFNMLFRLVIAFLPRSKCLLISWLQSPSAVILELKWFSSNL